jgi:hypothetical protein
VTLGIEASKASMKEGWQWFLPKTATQFNWRSSGNMAVFGLGQCCRIIKGAPKIKGSLRSLRSRRDERKTVH